MDDGKNRVWIELDMPCGAPIVLSACSDPNGGAWLVGDHGMYVTLMHFDGALIHDCGCPLMIPLCGVSCLGSDKLWAVGGVFGSTSVSDPLKDAYGAILFFDGHGWEIQLSCDGFVPSSVCAVDPNHVWVVGTSGVILFFDGEHWRVQDSSSSSFLEAVDAAGPENACAVGEDTILNFNGGGWVESARFPGFSLTGVCALDENHMWAVGSDDKQGITLFFDGNVWREQYRCHEGRPFVVSAHDRDRVFAAGLVNGGGLGGIIVCYDGHSWEVVRKWTAREAVAKANPQLLTQVEALNLSDEELEERLAFCAVEDVQALCAITVLESGDVLTAGLGGTLLGVQEVDLTNDFLLNRE